MKIIVDCPIRPVQPSISPFFFLLCWLFPTILSLSRHQKRESTYYHEILGWDKWISLLNQPERSQLLLQICLINHLSTTLSHSPTNTIVTFHCIKNLLRWWLQHSPSVVHFIVWIPSKPFNWRGMTANEMLINMSQAWNMT